jgi:hypothetical protein
VEWLELKLDQETPIHLERLSPKWRGFYENLRLLGYPDKVITEKRKELIENWPSVSQNLVRNRSVGYNSTYFPYGQLGYLASSPNDSQSDEKDWYPIMGLTLAQIENLKTRPSVVLGHLGYWANIKGFNATAFVEMHLRHGSVTQSDLKNLMYWSHVWVGGIRAPAKFIRRLLAHFKSTEHFVPYSWLTRTFKLPERSIRKIYTDYLLGLRKSVKKDQMPVYLLQILSNIPLHAIPKPIQDDLHSWIDLLQYPPIQMNSVHFCNSGYKETGDCEYMTNGHLSSLGIFEKSKDDKKNVFIMVDGLVVGSFKRTGDPSMIALRNVVDSEGKLILAIGGVYHINYDTADTLESVKVKNGQLWKVAKLDQLYLHPSTFLFNENTWDDLNFVPILKAMRRQLPNENLLDILFEFAEDQSLDKQKQLELTSTTWPLLIEKLDLVRQQLESKTKN